MIADENKRVAPGTRSAACSVLFRLGTPSLPLKAVDTPGLTGDNNKNNSRTNFSEQVEQMVTGLVAKHVLPAQSKSWAFVCVELAALNTLENQDWCKIVRPKNSPHPPCERVAMVVTQADKWADENIIRDELTRWKLPLTDAG